MSCIIIWSLCDIDIVSQCDCFYTANSGTLKWWQSCVKTALKIKIQSAGYWFGNQKLWIGAKLIKSISRSEAYFDVTIYQKFLKAYLSRVFTSFLLKCQLQSKIYWQTEIDTLNMHRMESKTLREDQNWVRYGQVSKWLMVSKGVVNDCNHLNDDDEHDNDLKSSHSCNVSHAIIPQQSLVCSKSKELRARSMALRTEINAKKLTVIIRTNQLLSLEQCFAAISSGMSRVHSNGNK